MPSPPTPSPFEPAFPQRSAHASIRGYLYQASLGVVRWLGPGEGEVLVCEGKSCSGGFEIFAVPRPAGSRRLCWGWPKQQRKRRSSSTAVAAVKGMESTLSSELACSPTWAQISATWIGGWSRLSALFVQIL